VHPQIATRFRSLLWWYSKAHARKCGRSLEAARDLVAREAPRDIGVVPIGPVRGMTIVSGPTMRLLRDIRLVWMCGEQLGKSVAGRA
jgi:hypothetical protein